MKCGFCSQPQAAQQPEAPAESMELLGMQADKLANLLGAMQLPMPAAFHLEQLKVALPEVVAKLREVYVLETGDDPWATHPESQS